MKLPVKVEYYHDGTEESENEVSYTKSSQTQTECDTGSSQMQTDFDTESSQMQIEKFHYDHSYAEPVDSTNNSHHDEFQSDAQCMETDVLESDDATQILLSDDDISVVHEAEEVVADTVHFVDFITEFNEKFKRLDFLVKCRETDLLLLKLYAHNRSPSVQLSVVIDSDFMCEIYVHRKKVDKSHSVWKGLPLIFDRVEAVDTLCDRLGMLNVCPGNPEVEYGELVPIGAGLFNHSSPDMTAYREGDFQALHANGLEYSSTIRTVDCELLTDRKFKCKCCQEYGACLKKRKSRLDERLTSNRGYIYSNFKHSDMTREELTKKLSEQKEEIDSLKIQMRKSQRVFEKEMSKRDDEVSKYKKLTDLMGERSSRQRLFWEQQLFHNQQCDKRAMRWHPMILQWCLDIRQKSTKAFDAVRDGGFITLPSNRTLNSSRCIKSELDIQGRAFFPDEKEGGFEFWKKILKSCQYVLAPMVDQSELAWRILSRRYGAQLCFTPMFHSSVFVKDAHYRRESLQTCKEDRPLIVQFCGNDPDIVLEAAKLAEDQCDAIDLNLGCPQMIARRGHYGAYLQDEWELLEKMVSTCHANLKVPITCKIRVFESVEKTVEYAKMLEKAGCQLLTVHGRTREMKGRLTGLANWEYVKAIKKAVNIPVFSNGNIQYLSDVKRCIEETGVDGVMTAEGNLHNPALFAGINPPIWQMCEEYFDLTERYPCPMSYIRGHVFKILHHGLHLHPDVRDMVGVARSPECLRKAVAVLKERCLKEMEDETFDAQAGLFGKLPLPYWYCQPYERPSPEQEERNRQKRELLTRPATIEELVIQKGMSKKKVKKRLRNPNKNFDAKKKMKFEICEDILCNNPKGQRCNFNMCKACCRKKTSEEVIDCTGHKIHFTGHPVAEQRKKDNEVLTERDTGNTNEESSELTITGTENTIAIGAVSNDSQCKTRNNCDTNESMETSVL